MQAKGTFTVNLNPLTIDFPGTEGNNLGRMRIEKNYSGELTASGHGEMLSVRTAVPQSAGYVAIEQVTGTLAGKRGSFILQHYGLMSPDGESLTMEIVPDSGTGEWQGIAGRLTIQRTGDEHAYQLEYDL